uniref:Phage shock protein A (PspA) family protein n=1 Tax=Candidatus Kentrum sp. TUN TaxID=2126343 RepID=A0A451AAT4_9GAMM|nr:MAG: phage shock protein A (PspA) family protein [Candidatus Kentron sp. TUN]VFK53493.1 MAG: phage shock protein A (PspA) family protein [Candidatus Kentron sp. TUN]VFK63148.1 MAG: phage shock protein A (PspA) family protein [Candidatus Kentron sp. TUN]
MSIWKKLFTAARGAATEAGEAIVDNQALRILDQEMRDARIQLKNAKESLTSIMAEEMAVKRTVNDLRSKIEEHESYTAQALEQGNEDLALEIANKIAEFSNELEAQEQLAQGYEANITQLKRTIADTERNIKMMQREVSVVKSTEAVQKANTAIATKFSGADSSMLRATDSLERIKVKQQKRSDQMKAAVELQKESSGDDLQAKLKSAGIVSGGASANAVLERIKAKKSAGK